MFYRDDSEYYALRVADEYRMAAAAKNPMAARIHEHMAHAYEDRVKRTGVVTSHFVGQTS